MKHLHRYEKQMDLAQRKIEALELRRSRLVSLRWIIFSLMVLAWGYLLFRNMSDLLVPTTIVAGVVFISSSWVISRLCLRRSRWEHYQTWQRFKLAQGQLDWNNLPAPRDVHPDAYRELDAQTAQDIGLLGPRSLSVLLDSTLTDEGHRRLHCHLGEDRSLEEIRFQQRLVQELEQADVFRNRFRMAGAGPRNLVELSTLRESFKARLQSRSFRFFTYGLGVLQLFNLALILMVHRYELRPYYLFSLAAVYFAHRLLQGFAADPLESGLAYQRALEKVMPLFSSLEKLGPRPEDPSYTLLGPIRNRPPSIALAKINIVVSLLGIKANPLLAVILNLLVPWDFLLLLRLETLRGQNATDMELWLVTIAKMDAALAITQYSLTTMGRFPDYEPGDDILLEAAGLGHPLISPQLRVGNSLSIRASEPVALITGSNMAGKSTFLKTIGLCLVLGKLGARVPGELLRLRNFQLISLIKAQDFLEKEMSLFFYEVSRLRAILEKAQAASPEAPVFFLIDEIYRGTNNQERYQGAVAYLRAISRLPDTSGLLTTHDISVAETLEPVPLISNYHFSEVYQNGNLAYDYLIHPGICRSTNALRIMARENLPVS